MLSVPASVKRKYDFDYDEIYRTHMDTIRQIVTALGYGQLFNKTIEYQVL